MHGKDDLVRPDPNEQPESDKVAADTGTSISVNGSANYRRSAHDAAEDLISLAGRGDQVGRQFVKRIFDLMVASALAVIFFPFVIVVALFVRKSGPRSYLPTQELDVVGKSFDATNFARCTQMRICV